tara:strand:+ start:531 stop:908 length:378 start_codon:yes stop_codon:yes gene_type:complete
MTIVRNANKRQNMGFKSRNPIAYISRKECPSCGEVEYKHIARNTQSKKCKCGTQMTAKDVAWEHWNTYREHYVGNEFSMGNDCPIEYVWKLDDRYAEEIMTLFPLNGQELISYSRYDRQQPDVFA